MFGPASCEKAGVKLRLQGQPIQVLATLLNSPGELVTREQLRAQVWPAETFVDFDHSLHNSIARLREALGDSAGTPRYIETLPRRGYRFIGTVERIGTEDSPPSGRTHAATVILLGSSACAGSKPRFARFSSLLSC